MFDVKRLKFTFVFLIFIASCTNVQQHSVVNLGMHPVHRLSSIKQKNGIIKIDTGVILNNKNLQSFINDVRESPMILSYKLDGIPQFIKSFLEHLSGDYFTMANPGKVWNCCDGGWNDSLPNRELICLGKDKSLFLMSYKTGGIGEAGHLVLIRYQDNKVTDFWTGTMLEFLSNKNAIVDYLVKNKDKAWGLNTNTIRI
ncbi:MAG TPA: hypothetical protein VIM16_13800 [Mucilaginibacter sp.]|jgi:hypothetical protein